MPKKTDLTSGANGILIRFLRERGGSAEFNARELSKSNNLYPTAIGRAAYSLRLKGLLKLECRRGRSGISKCTLNEEAIREYEASGKVAAREPQIGARPRKNKQSSEIINSLKKDFFYLLDYEFREKSARQAVEDLMIAAGELLKEQEGLGAAAAQLLEDGAKLKEAARGLGASEVDIEKAASVNSEEIASAVDYGDLPAIPMIDFTDKNLLKESSKIFKPLAQLRSDAVRLRNLVVDHKRTAAKATIANKNLAALVKELQSVEAVSFDARIKDWKEKSDKVISGQLTKGLAVVSSKQ